MNARKKKEKKEGGKEKQRQTDRQTERERQREREREREKERETEGERERENNILPDMLLIFYAESENFPLYGFRFSVLIECEYPSEDESFNQCGAPGAYIRG